MCRECYLCCVLPHLSLAAIPTCLYLCCEYPVYFVAGNCSGSSSEQIIPSTFHPCTATGHNAKSRLHNHQYPLPGNSISKICQDHRATNCHNQSSNLPPPNHLHKPPNNNIGTCILQITNHVNREISEVEIIEVDYQVLWVFLPL